MLPSKLSLVRSSLNAKREQKFDDKSPINYDHNLRVWSRKYEQFTSNYDCRVVIYVRRSFIKFATE